MTLLEESLSDLDVHVGLLLRGEVILRDVSVEVLETGGLAKAEDLIMNESVGERVELVNVVGDLATFVRNLFRDKVVGAEGHLPPYVSSQKVRGMEKILVAVSLSRHLEGERKMKSNLVAVQVGQCGNQLGLDFFSALAREGGQEEEAAANAGGGAPLYEHLSTFFRETPRRRGGCCSTARAVLLDAEPRVIAHVAANSARDAPPTRQWQYTGPAGPSDCKMCEHPAVRSLWLKCLDCCCSSNMFAGCRQ